jgi:hypothetical protein
MCCSTRWRQPSGQLNPCTAVIAVLPSGQRPAPAGHQKNIDRSSPKIPRADTPAAAALSSTAGELAPDAGFVCPSLTRPLYSRDGGLDMPTERGGRRLGRGAAVQAMDCARRRTRHRKEKVGRGMKAYFRWIKSVLAKYSCVATIH